MKANAFCNFSLHAFYAVAFAAALTACGGSDDSPPEPIPAAPTPVTPAPTAPAIVSGTAAVGAALANANVMVTDVVQRSVCEETTVVTSGTGAFTCTVRLGTAAPFLVVVTDPLGAYPPMVSIVATSPTPGTTLVANATPLTTAIVSQIAPNGDALWLVDYPAFINLANLSSVTQNVLLQIAPVLTALGAPAGYDPFTTQIVAATSTQGGNTADQVIEMLRFSEVDGVTYVSTIDDPAGAVPIANATTSSPPLLPTPSSAVLTLSDVMRLLTNSLTQCFALPVADRVEAVDTTIPLSQGGPTVTINTRLAPECQSFVHRDYLHNGYAPGQRFYGLLTSSSMVGATFLPPEVLLFIDDTTDRDNDQAVLNIRYVDANGTVGNIIDLVRKLPATATATHPTDWWLYGNQQPVDTSIRSFVRRHEQLAPFVGIPPFHNALPSRYETGIVLFVNKDGPNSTGMRAARITGPGLPPAGVVLTRPSPAIVTDHNGLNIRRKDGLTDPSSATFAADVGNIFRLQRTEGIDGSTGTVISPNPAANSSNTVAFPHWAHPIDYGAEIGAGNYIDFSQLKANSVYRIEIFYDGETMPRYTIADKRMLTPVVRATRVANLQWVQLTDSTLRYLDPVDRRAFAQSSMDLSWTANPYAEPISSAGVYAYGLGFGGWINVNATAVPVAPGATSAVAIAPGRDFPLLDIDGSSSRLIQLRYRMLDGSHKDSTWRFN